MLRRLQRPAAALISVLVMVPAVAGCGSDSSAKDSTSSGTSALDEVSFTGDVGKSITAKWHTKLAKPKTTTVTTLVKGDGDKVASGDTVSTYLWVGNGSTKKVAYSDYTNGPPESIPNNGQVGPVFDKLFEDATYGSRVAAVTTPTELLGSSAGNPQLGIGANDTLVVVADLVKKAAVSPTPSDDKAHDVCRRASRQGRGQEGQAHRAELRGHLRALADHPGPARRPQAGQGRPGEGHRHGHRQLPRRDLQGEGALRRELHQGSP